MRKIIDGRTYNTETSKLIGDWSNERSNRDFSHCYQALYRNTKGAYFLHGYGGPMSEYARHIGGETINPMTAEDAQAWAEKHLFAETVEAEFGAQEEAAPSDLTTRERVNMVIDSELMAKLRKYSSETGVPMSRIMDKAIIKFFEA